MAGACPHALRIDCATLGAVWEVEKRCREGCESNVAQGFSISLFHLLSLFSLLGVSCRGSSPFELFHQMR